MKIEKTTIAVCVIMGCLMILAFVVQDAEPVPAKNETACTGEIRENMTCSEVFCGREECLEAVGGMGSYTGSTACEVKYAQLISRCVKLEGEK